MSVTPRSRARRMTAIASSPSTVRPKVFPPTPRAEIFSPEFPSLRSCISATMILATVTIGLWVPEFQGCRRRALHSLQDTAYAWRPGRSSPSEPFRAPILAGGPQRRACRGPPAGITGSSLGRDDRQQQVGLAPAAGVELHFAAKKLGRPVLRIVVDERSAAPRGVVEALGELVELAPVLVVLAADGEPDAVAGRDDNAGRPDLDF